MNETSTWSDQSRENLRETLRYYLQGETRLMNSDGNKILEACREIYIEDECPENEWGSFVQFATDELQRASAAHTTDQKSWPAETDCDRLDCAEQHLRNQGILLWQVSPCCDTCTGSELPDRIDEIERRFPGFRERVRGYAFFIDQNMPEMLAESTEISVYLAYGWFSADDSNVKPEEYERKALGIAHEVCATLRECGLVTDWDGDLSKKIGLSLNWRRRTVLE